MLYVNAPINDLSYGLVSVNILRNLQCDYRLYPMRQFSFEEYPDISKKVFDSTTNLDHNIPSLKIWHEYDLFYHIGRGPRVAFPIFEKNRFNPQETWNIKNQDKVLVCSNWAKNIVQKINTNVHVCPLGVDADFTSVPLNSHPDQVIFYTLGKREARKGHDYLHKVFHKAFSEYNNVQLWMFTNNPFDKQEETNNFQLEYKRLLGNKVKFFPRMSKLDMLKWLSMTDFGVFLSRAEGWNLPLLESMAMGKHVLGTYYSGHTEFLPKDQGFEPNGMIEARDNKWFNGGFDWAHIELNEDEIVERLRKMVELKGIKNQNNASIAKKYTWKNTADKVYGSIFN